jgi:ATP-binding cassette, subfamily F, member 3
LERPNIRINFRVDKTPGKVLVELKDISKAFGENVIVKKGSVEINRGDKIALIGANGKGKSTLLRIIAGVEKYDGGDRKWGHNVEESFYAQHQLEHLDLNNTILDEMKTCGSQQTEQELRTLMGCFLFSGDDTDKKIKVLSGGEKARVALAKTIISKANFLLLDEPTNHLDMHSCDLLIESLNKYEGTLILVSHDRYFVSKTATKIWEIIDHEIKEFAGGYDEYAAWKKRMLDQKNTKPEAANTPAKEKEPAKNGKKEPAPNPPQVNKGANKELQKTQRLFQQLEEKISKLTQHRKDLETAMSLPETYSNSEKFIQTEKEYKKTDGELKQLNDEYEKVFETIMKLEAEVGS